MRRFQTIFALLLVTVLLTGCGITAPRGNEGYANLDSLGMTDVDNKMTLSFGPTVLRFAARHMDEDEETKALLRDLDGVRIRVYEIDRNPDRVAGRVDDMSLKLQGQGWEPIALIQEDGERTHLLVKMSGDQIVGLTLVTCDRSEAVVINVMGELRPEYFSDAMAALDVDAPDVQIAAAHEDLPTTEG